MTLLTAGALTDPRMPATASNVYTTDARLGGVGQVPTPPNKNPGYATGSIEFRQTGKNHQLVDNLGSEKKSHACRTEKYLIGIT